MFHRDGMWWRGKVVSVSAMEVSLHPAWSIDETGAFPEAVSGRVRSQEQLTIETTQEDGTIKVDSRPTTIPYMGTTKVPCVPSKDEVEKWEK